MSISFRHFALGPWALAAAIAVAPAAAFGWGSQAGDNGRQPIGADNEGPRQSVPNASTNGVPVEYQAEYQQALYDCSQVPVPDRAACRDAAASRYGYPSDDYVATHPPYMTYYYEPSTTYSYSNDYPNAPVYYWRFQTYGAPSYYVAPSYPGDTSYAEVNSSNRCIPLYAAARAECLHGSLPGD